MQLLFQLPVTGIRPKLFPCPVKVLRWYLDTLVGTYEPMNEESTMLVRTFRCKDDGGSGDNWSCMQNSNQIITTNQGFLVRVPRIFTQ